MEVGGNIGVHVFSVAPFLLQLDAQGGQIVLVAIEALEADGLSGLGCAHIVESAVQGHVHAHRCVLHARQRLQLLLEEHGLLRVLLYAEGHQAVRLISQGRMDHVQGVVGEDGRYRHQHNGDEMLHRHERAAQRGLAFQTEGAAHHVYGLHGGHHLRRHDACHGSQQHHCAYDEEHVERAEQLHGADVGLQQLVGVGDGCHRQQQGHRHGHGAQAGALQHHTHHDVALQAAQQTAGGHLLCPAAGLRHGQVDVVHHGKRQDDESDDGNEHHQRGLAAAAHVAAIF